MADEEALEETGRKEPSRARAGTITECGPEYSNAQSGLCDVEGGSARVLLRGDVMLPDELLRRGQVLIDGDTILCAGCGCEDTIAAVGATKITCPDGLITPGLINAHEHLNFTERPPPPDTGHRYNHRNEWRLEEPPNVPQWSNMYGKSEAWGEMRHVFGGATSVVGGAVSGGFLRNLDRKPYLGNDLVHTRVCFEVFPLNDGALETVSSCDQFTAEDTSMINNAHGFAPHVAEGVNERAALEFTCLHDLEPEWVTDGAGIIHALALRPPDIIRMVDEAGLLWSPRSNTRLYGMTARAPLFDRLGVDIGIGTDWLATGSMSMPRELACAKTWSETYWNGYFTDEQLVGMATHVNARILGFDDVLGRLEPSLRADITIWNASEDLDYAAVVNAGPDDVALVLRGGAPLYGDRALVEALVPNRQHRLCELLDVCGVEKRLCAEREIEEDTTTLRGEILEALWAPVRNGEYDEGLLYPLFYCGDEPEGEPECVPKRDGYTGVIDVQSGDLDGDGLIESDNCPNHFNPPRPVDSNSLTVQADHDNDGKGDICDPCPLDPEC